jgi:hypothetical protein
MNKASTVFLSILLLSLPCSAQFFDEFASDFTIPFQVSLDNVPDTLEVEMYVVYGKNIDSFENLISDSLTTNPPKLSSAAALVDGQVVTKDVKLNLHFLSENNTSLEDLKKGYGVVILVGGETHNNLTAEAYSAGYVTNETTRFSGKLTVAGGKLDNDTSLMILKHNIPNETDHLEREGVKYSPLIPFVPESYIPLAATGIGMLLMTLFNLFKAMIESLTGELGKKRMSYEHKGIRILGIINLKEALNLIIAALVLGFAVTWTFTGPTPKFMDYILLNTGICLVAGLSHDLIHRILSRLFKIKVEYRLWYTGSFITIFTAILGNSFGMQGFLLEKPQEEISKWKYGIMKLAGPLFSMGIAGSFALLYTKQPGIMYQMIFTTASIIAMAEIMPVKGLDGYDIREWNRWLYVILFAVITIAFFFIGFIG